MGNIKSQRKLCLLPEGADQSWPALATSQLSARFPAQVQKIFRAEVGQRMAFEMTPDVFDRIEFRSISRKICQDDLALSVFDVASNRATAMHRQTVPDHQQLAANLATK